jgi:hypothetical protein
MNQFEQEEGKKETFAISKLGFARTVAFWFAFFVRLWLSIRFEAKTCLFYLFFG